ncbi:hypothetical protein Tco_0986509 [Tanacetum coccineum]
MLRSSGDIPVAFALSTHTLHLNHMVNILRSASLKCTNASMFNSSTTSTRNGQDFVEVVKQRQEIDTVSYHKLFDVLKQFQNEAPKPQRSNAPSYMQSSSTRPSVSTRHKGKEIAKPVTPQSESVSEEDKAVQTYQQNLRTSSNSRNKTEDTTPKYNNDNQSGQFRIKDDDSFWARKRRPDARSKGGLKTTRFTRRDDDVANKLNKRVPLQAGASGLARDTDEEID